jgi:GT2 family glycosyltransferase
MPDFRSVSIVIPTHDRCESLREVLSRLERQNGAPPIQVIVVADGCTDETAAVVSAFSGSFDCRLITQASSGPSRARNAGAQVATGELLIFLDDDIIASEDFVAAHLRAHRALSGENSVVIGYCPPSLAQDHGFYTAYLRQWWEQMFERMEEPGRRFEYVDLLSGNFSISRRLFHSSGGFDEQLRCHEDFELGIRLIKAGAMFAFERGALGLHNTRTDQRDSLSRKFAEGRADWRIAKLHPEQAANLPLFRSPQCERGLAAASLPIVPQILDFVHRLGAQLAHVLGMRRKWLHRTYSRYNLAYCRGVVAEAGGLAQAKAALAAARSRRPCPHNLDYDLAAGLRPVEAQLDSDRPAGASLWLGGNLVGTIWADDTVEKLHGGHLRPWLATTGWYGLLTAGGLGELRMNLNPRLARFPKPATRARIA